MRARNAVCLTSNLKPRPVRRLLPPRVSWHLPQLCFSHARRLLCAAGPSVDEMYEHLEQMLDQCPEVHSLTAITFLQVGRVVGFVALP